MITFFLFASMCALGEALKDIFSKRGLGEIDPLSLTWLLLILTLIICGPFALYQGIPSLSTEYFYLLPLHASMFGVSLLIYMEAIRRSDLSLTVPLIMSTPAIMLITSPLITGEKPSVSGALGVLLIVFGSYVLNASKVKAGLLAPFRALFEQSGARLMLLVAVIWSLTAPIDKIGIASSSPIFWGLSDYLLIVICLTPWALPRILKKREVIRSHTKIVMGMGIANSVQMFGYVFGMAYGQAVYLLSMKRTSVLIVILVSHFLLKEKGFSERFAGSLIMLAGVLTILLA